MERLPPEILLQILCSLDVPSLLNTRAWYLPSTASSSPSHPPDSNRRLHQIATTHELVIISALSARLHTTPDTPPISTLPALQRLHLDSKLFGIARRFYLGFIRCYSNPPHTNHTIQQMITEGLSVLSRVARRTAGSSEDGVLSEIVDGLDDREALCWCVVRAMGLRFGQEVVVDGMNARVVLDGLDPRVRPVVDDGIGGREQSLWKRFGTVVERQRRRTHGEAVGLMAGFMRHWRMA